MGTTVSNMADLLAGGSRPGLGSIGFFAYHQGEGRRPVPVLVGNQHVLCAHGVGKGSLVFQPGLRAGAHGLEFPAHEMTAIAENTGISAMGHVDFAYPEEAARQFFVDAATARLLPAYRDAFENRPGEWMERLHGAMGQVARLHPADVSLGGRMDVWKYGRTTRLTRGKVMDVKATVEGPDGQLRKNVIVVKGWNHGLRPGPAIFCAEGDSGAPLFDSRGRLVGILWGMNPQQPEIGYASHIHPILAALKLTVAKPFHQMHPLTKEGRT
jgi:hypothetical protein